MGKIQLAFGVFMLLFGIALITLAIIEIRHTPQKWYLYAAVLMQLYIVRDSIKLIKKSN